jgi:hypothetical protein
VAEPAGSFNVRVHPNPRLLAFPSLYVQFPGCALLRSRSNTYHKWYWSSISTTSWVCEFLIRQRAIGQQYRSCGCCSFTVVAKSSISDSHIAAARDIAGTSSHPIQDHDGNQPRRFAGPLWTHRSESENWSLGMTYRKPPGNFLVSALVVELKASASFIVAGSLSRYLSSAPSFDSSAKVERRVANASFEWPQT